MIVCVCTTQSFAICGKLLAEAVTTHHHSVCALQHIMPTKRKHEATSSEDGSGSYDEAAIVLAEARKRKRSRCRHATVYNHNNLCDWLRQILPAGWSVHPPPDPLEYPLGNPVSRVPWTISVCKRASTSLPASHVCHSRHIPHSPPSMQLSFARSLDHSL